MEIDLQHVLLMAQIRSMAILLDARLGEENPWRTMEFDEYSNTDLTAIKRLMHELLYSPPPRT